MSRHDAQALPRLLHAVCPDGGRVHEAAPALPRHARHDDVPLGPLLRAAVCAGGRLPTRGGRQPGPRLDLPLGHRNQDLHRRRRRLRRVGGVRRVLRDRLCRGHHHRRNRPRRRDARGPLVGGDVAHSGLGARPDNPTRLQRPRANPRAAKGLQLPRLPFARLGHRPGPSTHDRAAAAVADARRPDLARRRQPLQPRLPRELRRRLGRRACLPLGGLLQERQLPARAVRGDGAGQATGGGARGQRGEGWGQRRRLPC
mmetsp:Transcript_1483/g.4365  ORF Transcript_1483/g.4365 Transcript_1483/m.4365 type:complete len:257 (+) Transcript_1483:3678-4448(+)